jgi:RNA polymerase sigma-70 factor (ECF subfamily)
VQNHVRDARIDPERLVLVKERIEAVRSATAQLPEPERTVFVLRYLEELAFPMIAAITGLKEAAARGRAYRALDRVRNRVISQSFGCEPK